MICLLVARDLVKADEDDDDDGDGAASIFHNCMTHGIGVHAQRGDQTKRKMPVLVDQLDLRATLPWRYFHSFIHSRTDTPTSYTTGNDFVSTRR